MSLALKHKITDDGSVAKRLSELLSLYFPLWKTPSPFEKKKGKN